ncbi:MAG: ABC-2 family transporter protein [Pirellulales bacterium]
MNPMRPSYLRVFLTFARNSLIRDMMFPTNFVIEAISSIGWMMMNLGFYMLIFRYTNHIGAGLEDGSAWGKYQFFVFIATTMFINSLVQAFFMPNAQEFSELIRTGGLDFALLKPIDTQFLISLNRFSWSSLANFVVALMLLFYAVPHLEGFSPHWWHVAFYVFYIGVGMMILYSLMISMAATSIWLGRNQSLYNFWFYITNFSRYPMEIYSGTWGTPMRNIFTFLIPILVVINVPARMLAKPFHSDHAYLAAYALAAMLVSLLASRWVFKHALKSYRSASS